MNAQLSNKSSFAEDRLSALRLEIKALRKVRHEEVRNEANSRRWFSTKRRLPAADIRAVVWSDEQLRFAWFTDGKWFSFDGTWFVKAKDEIQVSHWMGTDWMTSEWFPSRGPGFVNWLKSVWSTGTHSAVQIMRPKSSNRNAQIAKKAVFYRNPKTGETMGGYMGGKIPHGFETIVCNSAAEVERWSQRQREWDSANHERIQEERERIEGPMKAELRAEMHHRLSNARNSVNRDFLRAAIERDGKKAMPMRYRRESYLHCEAHEE